MTKYLWCAFLIVTYYGSVCAVAWAEVTRLTLSEPITADNTVTFSYSCAKNGHPVGCTPTEAIYPCLAKMQAAMEAREPYFEKPNYQRKYFNHDEYSCDKTCLQAKLKDIENQENFNADKEKAIKLWESTKRECWRQP